MDDILTEAGIVELLGISKNKLTRLIRRKSLPCIELSDGSKVFLAGSLLNWLKRLEVNSQPAPAKVKLAQPKR